jgi:hypothetical protein
MDVEAVYLCDMNVVGVNPNIEMDLDPSLRGRHTLGENDNGGGEYYPRGFECPGAGQRNHAVDENSDDGRDCPTDWACPNRER